MKIEFYAENFRGRATQTMFYVSVKLIIVSRRFTLITTFL